MPDNGHHPNNTRQKTGRPHRRLLSIGCCLFVIGIAIAAYCGYHERYGDGILNAWIKLAGWTMLVVGLVLFLFGLFQSPIRRP